MEIVGSSDYPETNGMFVLLPAIDSESKCLQSVRAVWGLILIEFFSFGQQKNCLLARNTGLHQHFAGLETRTAYMKGWSGITVTNKK